MFAFFRKFKRKKDTKESVGAIKALWDTDFRDIWNIEDKSSFICAMNGWVCKKSSYGDNVERLSQAEKVLYFVVQLEGEVNNGGFSQFSYNSSGNFANETPAALREIGAEKTAEICDKALSAFEGRIPQDWNERQTMLEYALTDEVNKVLDECDDEFYICPENLDELNYQFVMKSRGQFTR